MEKKDLAVLQQSVKALFEANRYKECIDLAFELLSHGQIQNDCSSLDVAYYSIALASYYNGDIHQAFTYIVKYDDYSLKSGQKQHRLNAYSLNYLLYMYLEDYMKAERDLRLAIQLAKELHRVEMLASCYKRLATIYNELQRYEEAEQHALKSLHYAKQTINYIHDHICNAYIQLIYCYIGQQKFDYAACYIEDLITLGLENLHDRQKASTLNAMGRYYFATDELEDSLNMYFNAKAYAQSCFDLKLLSSIQRNIIEQCEFERNFTLGYEIQREYIETILELNKKDLTAAAMQLEAKRNLAEIERRATRDPLTGICNRSHLEQTTNDWLTSGAQVACLAFDIDRFKLINDEYGHLIGDEVLKALVATCNEHLQRDDILFARYGGDEFVIMLRDMSLPHVLDMATLLMEDIREIEVQAEEEMIHITVSIGIAFNEYFTTFYELFKKADEHLYKAKALGRNQIYFAELQSK